MKNLSINTFLTPTLFVVIASLSSCFLTDPPCPASELLGTLNLSDTALSFFPANPSDEYVFEDTDGNERVWHVDYDSSYQGLPRELICSNGKNEQAYNYYETEYRNLQYTSGRDRFTVRLYLDWDKGFDWSPRQDLPMEYLVVMGETDSNWTNLMINADSASFKKLYHESITFRDRTFTEVFRLEHVAVGNTIYYSVDIGVVVIIQDEIEWVVKED